MLMVILSLLLLAGCMANEATRAQETEDLEAASTPMGGAADRPWRVPDDVDVEDWIREIIAGYEGAAGVEAHVRAHEDLKSLETWIEDQGLLGRSVGSSVYGELFSAVMQHVRDARTASMTETQLEKVRDFRGECEVSAHRVLRLGPDYWAGDLTASAEDLSLDFELPDEAPVDPKAYLDGLRTFPSIAGINRPKRHATWAKELERDYALMRTIAHKAAHRMALLETTSASEYGSGRTEARNKWHLSRWRELAERADRSARVASKMHRAFSVSDVYEAFRIHVSDCIDAKKAKLMGIEGRFDEWIPQAER